MKEYLVVSIVPPTKIINSHIKSFSKKGAYECVKATEDKNIIVLNIIEL